MCHYSSSIKDFLLDYFAEDQLWDFYGGSYQWKPAVKNCYKLLGAPQVDNEEEEEQQGRSSQDSIGETGGQ